MSTNNSTKRNLTTLFTLGAATTAQAVVNIGTSISIAADSEGGSFPRFTDTWDIDGNGTDEASFRASAASSTAFSSSFLNLVVNNGVANFGFMLSGTNVINSLSNYQVVGSMGNFASKLSQFFSNSSSEGSSQFSSNLTTGVPQNTPIPIGFRFDRGGATHYGIAYLEYTFDVPNLSTGISFTDVLWNDVPDQGITGAGTAVPEPASAATGLGLLALGVAGLRRWRRTGRD